MIEHRACIVPDHGVVPLDRWKIPPTFSTEELEREASEFGYHPIDIQKWRDIITVFIKERAEHVK